MIYIFNYIYQTMDLCVIFVILLCFLNKKNIVLVGLHQQVHFKTGRPVLVSRTA